MDGVATYSADAGNEAVKSDYKGGKVRKGNQGEGLLLK
jgi:hypothetical protein